MNTKCLKVRLTRGYLRPRLHLLDTAACCATQVPWVQERCARTGVLRALQNVSSQPLLRVRFMLSGRGFIAQSLPVKVAPGEKLLLGIRVPAQAYEQTLFVHWFVDGAGELLWSTPVS